MAPNPASSWLRPFPAWVAVWCAVLGFVAWDAISRSRHVLELSASYGVAVDAPKVDPRSPTGYAEGRRSLLLPPGAADAAHWVMQTQTMAARGDARIRRVNYDNAPHGREVHWAAPLHWWLAAIAWVDQLGSNRPSGIAIERAALVAGPAMLAVFLLGLTPFLARRFAAGGAALGALLAVAAFPFYTDFIAGRADHHGLANICALLTVLLLAAGATSAARRWCIGSALAGGIGLWVSAATLVPVLAGTAAAIVAAGWICRREPQAVAWVGDPGVFRTWGLVGGGVSLVAYGIEYLPSHAGFRLEVNHPLYAAAWAGGGELLRIALTGLRDGVSKLGRRDLVGAAVGATLVAAVPLTMVGATAQTFTVADPFVWQFHSLYIAEFQGLGRQFATKGFSWALLESCLPFLLLLPPVGMIFRSAVPAVWRAQLVLSTGPAALAWAMGAMQIRWLGLAVALTIPAVAVFFAALAAQAGNTRAVILRWAFAGGMLLLPGAWLALQRAAPSEEISREELLALAERDVAHWLRLRAGPDRITVAATPSPTTRLIYHGGLNGVGTLYWENANGLKQASALFAATSAEAARDLARRLGITHIVLFSWDAFEVVQAKLYRGVAEDAPLPADLFIANLLTAPVPPPWLRALPFRLPAHPALTKDQVRIWEVTPEQTPAEAAAHAASYYLELKKPELAVRLAPTLATHRDDLLAAVMLAGIASRQRDTAGFSAAGARIAAQLGQAGALSLGDHVHLVVVLAVGQQIEAARAQLQAALKKADAASLRQLTPGTLSDLLALGDALGVEMPEPALRRLAQELIPPAQRK